ncbi:MAG: hypothetical protein NTZ83_05050 [Candidatus Pacearchaeota archaeon]|nr:hypothetical protein [Candidatus Pacearchaeota archaeon]
MFSYDSLLDRRRLEDFLNSEPREEHSRSEEETPKENLVTQVVNYFTKNSKIGYTYHFNESKNDVEYTFPRSFSEDIRNIRDYFVNLFSKD